MRTRCVALIGSAVVLACCGIVSAVQPSLSAVTPYGFQRGTDVEATFSGARLEDAEKLLFYSPGFEVKKIEPVNANAIKVTVAVAADCRIGIHGIRIQTKTGMSNLKTFTVGALPSVDEVEPNSDFDTPQVISMNVTVHGVVQSEDQDFFVVEAKKGERIVAELEGIRLGYTFFDPYLAILDSKRFELARSDDASLLRQDCLCSVVAPEDGKYLVQIRETAYGGNGSCKYRLHIGSFPRPTAVLPAGGRPGEEIEVRWIGDPAGDWTQKVKLPANEDEKFGLFAEDDKGIAASPNVIRVVDLENAIEAEPNNDRAKATAGVAPGAFNGVIQEPGDVDYFKFNLKKGQQLDVRVYARKTLRSPLDSVIAVYRPNGSALGSNDDSGGPDSYLRINPPEDGEYTVLIRDHLNAGGPGYVYRIELTPIKQQLVMTLPEKQRYVATRMVVHKGNRMALLVNASRQNFGGDLKVDFENLPPGVGYQAQVMKANRGDTLVMFTGDAAASTGGTLANLMGRPVDENLKIVGNLSQRTMLVRGQNNRDVWGHDAKRMAACLADEVPFTIEIVQPQVPVVRSGSMGLKVIAKRKEGFKAAIAIRMLYNPPGIASSGSISIPAEKNEAVIPITANGGADISRPWPIVVQGIAAHGGGSVEVSSQIAELTIAEPFFTFTYDKAAGEQKTDTSFLVKLVKKSDFEGVAKVKLVGLPANTSTKTPEIEVTKDTTEIEFPVTIAEAAKPATYKSLTCQAILVQNNEPITYTQGGGELRVDKPLPPKVAAKPAPKATAKPAPKVAAAPPKRLTRLEQLRLEKKKAKEAAAGGSGE